MVGQNIGKYKVLDRVGRGGMGTVFRALDETLNREVAIKILNAELNDPEVARRFRAEAVTVARLNHPGIATIFELFQHDGQWMMVMEFVRGETLEHMVERMGPLSPQRAADLLMQGLAALSHAHRMGVVHRDLKPANLMITESGAVKIMDFGIARVAGSEHLTSAGFLMGTPAYMAPEQVTGGEIDARTDLYSMGVVFYYLVTARLPFKGDNPIAMAQSRVNDRPIPVGTVREGLPAWIEPLLDRVLSKTVDDRFQSADHFREALRRGLAGLPMETLSGLSLPPELVATTPPGTVPLPSMSGSIGGTPAPSTTPPGPLPSGTLAAGTTPPATTPLSTSMDPSARLPISASQTSASKKLPIPPQTTSKKGVPNFVAIGLAAVAVILVVLIGVTWVRSRIATNVATPVDTVQPTPAASSTPAATSTPEVTASPTPADTTAPVTLTSPTASPAASPTGSPGAATPTVTPTTTPGSSRSGALPSPGATTSGTPGPTPAGAPAGSPTPSPNAGGRATPTPPARGLSPALDAEHVAFSDVKYVTVRGDKGDDEDAVINFVAGQISVTSKRGGPALVSEQYRRIVHATYVHAKNPKWDAQLPGPPPTLDLSNFLRSARHWLVLQTRSSFVILRLEDANWKQILDTFETRTGLKIERPAATDK